MKGVLTANCTAKSTSTHRENIFVAQSQGFLLLNVPPEDVYKQWFFHHYKISFHKIQSVWYQCIYFWSTEVSNEHTNLTRQPGTSGVCRIGPGLSSRPARRWVNILNYLAMMSWRWLHKEEFGCCLPLGYDLTILKKNSNFHVPE